MHVPSIICYKIGIYSIKYVVIIHTVLGSIIHPRELSETRRLARRSSEYNFNFVLYVTHIS